MTSNETLVRVINHELITVKLQSDCIVHVYIHPNTEINIPLQNEMIRIYNDLTGGRKAVFLFEAGEFVSITKEARYNAIKMEKDTPTYASAILVKNLGQKIIADFYYKVNRPLQPYRVFSDREKALYWLKEQQTQLFLKHDLDQCLSIDDNVLLPEIHR